MGAPVFDASGQPVAGIGVCINKVMLGTDRGERHREAVLNAAHVLSQRLGADLRHLEPATSKRPRTQR
jgi:DNA-binding IclR family transcriptional regulator